MQVWVTPHPFTMIELAKWSPCAISCAFNRQPQGKTATFGRIFHRPGKGPRTPRVDDGRRRTRRAPGTCHHGWQRRRAPPTAPGSPQALDDPRDGAHLGDPPGPLSPTGGDSPGPGTPPTRALDDPNTSSTSGSRPPLAHVVTPTTGHQSSGGHSTAHHHRPPGRPRERPTHRPATAVMPRRTDGEDDAPRPRDRARGRWPRTWGRAIRVPAFPRRCGASTPDRPPPDEIARSGFPSTMPECTVEPCFPAAGFPTPSRPIPPV